MLLSEVTSELCNTPFFYLNDLNVWTPAEMPCILTSYDRFISDRAFGQKKRLLNTPGDSPMPVLNRYLRVGKPDDGAVYCVESENTDQDEHGPYYNIYMLRECGFPLKVFGQVLVKTMASGEKVYGMGELPGTYWCDLERYGASKSDEMPIDYTTFTITMPITVPLPPDCRLEVDVGYQKRIYAIVERFDLMNSVQLRVRELDGG